MKRLEIKKRMLAKLLESGLSAETIAAAGIKPLEAAATRRRTGYGAISMLIPYFNVKGERLQDFWRVRMLEHVEDDLGNEVRYTQPSRKRNKTGNRVYFPPDFSVGKNRIYIVEGEFKGLRLWQYAHTCIALGGVNNIYTQSKGPLIAELRALAAAGHEFVIAFDGNVRDNKKVQRAQRTLANELTNAGASAVYLLDLPDDSQLDEWHVANGDDAFRALPLRPFVPPSVVQTLKFDALDPAAIREPPPERSYVITPWIGSGLLTFFAGTGGLGKTMLMLDLALHVAIGARRWFGMKVRQGRVVMLALEDPLDELMRRLHYIVARYCKHQQLSSSQRRELRKTVAENLRIESLEGKALRLLKEQDRNIEQTPELAALAGKLKPLSPSLIVIDPMSQLHALNENDNAVGSAVVNALGYLRTATGAAVVVPVHTSKEGDRGRGRDTMAGVRGASSIVFGGRSVIYLSVLDPKEAAQRFDVEEADACDRFARFSHVKQNYGIRYDTIYAVRGEEGIWHLHNPEDIALREKPGPDQWAKLVQAWLKRGKIAHFTKTQVTQGQLTEIFGTRFSRTHSEAAFEEAQRSGTIRKLTKEERKDLPPKRGGGTPYTFAAEVSK